MGVTGEGEDPQLVAGVNQAIINMESAAPRNSLMGMRSMVETERNKCRQRKSNCP